MNICLKVSLKISPHLKHKNICWSIYSTDKSTFKKLGKLVIGLKKLGHIKFYQILLYQHKRRYNLKY